MSAVQHNHERGSRASSKETFMTKYIFSQDHKMISKQYLITGLFMGIIGICNVSYVPFAIGMARKIFWNF